MNECKPGCFKEAVCVEAQRIFDSCCDKDCLEDLPVQLESGCVLSESATIVKSRCSEVISACINVEPVAFNKGFYSVDITYTFRITLDTYEAACSDPNTVYGRAVFTKKVILYGGEGCTKTFSSTEEPVCTPCGQYCPPDKASHPKATVQVVEPIVLDAKLITKYCCEPLQMSQNCGCGCEQRKIVCGIAVTLGIFSIVQLSRAVSVMIPVYDYCVPQKECCITSTETPCEMFEKIQFPTNVFFPSSPECDLPSCGCDSGPHNPAPHNGR